jgi:23S rRNA pseudouridine1911/1915/1917 synthase
MSQTDNFPEQEGDLFEHYRFVADPGQSILRIDKFLMTRIENASRNKIQQAAAAGSILVNGVAVKQNYKVKPGDVISIVLTEPPRDTEIVPENIALDMPISPGHWFMHSPITCGKQVDLKVHNPTSFIA